MPVELPYLPSYKNVGTLFDKIKTAKIPETFTTRYLSDILGIKSTGDRALITLLKNLDFLDNTGKPTERYSTLKNDAVAKKNIAEAIKEAYEPLFSANENAHELGRDELKGLISQVAGAGENTTKKILGTFSALCGIADFSAEPRVTKRQLPPGEKTALPEKETTPEKAGETAGPDFHYNLQIHLPSNASEETL